jgi:leucine dehydrogenase
MSPFGHPEFDAHEQVMYCHDRDSGLLAIIAVHSTVLGPAAGGCRMYPYASAEDALTDVLRLSRGMSYKNAVADLPLGGGKSVIIADPSRPDKANLLRAFSQYVQSLGGRYWTAVDVGVGPEDADVLAENCDFVFARASQYPDGFNPSLFTAYGGFTGMRAVAAHVWGRTELRGLRVAIQGLGATGRDLARQLHDAGAELTVADIDDDAVRYVVDNYDARAVDPNEIHAQDVEVFAPCALGSVVNDRTLPEIKAKAICGLANNQLAEPHHGDDLRASGIVYVPDYVVNSGGMIGAGRTIFSVPDQEASWKSITGLYDIIRAILEKADAENRASSAVADEMAQTRISAAGAIPSA